MGLTVPLAVPRVLIIADDLTGAMDSASPFAARGLSTCVLTNVEAEDDVTGAQILAVNTESRHQSALHAARCVQTAWLRFGAGRSVLIKKIDSTLRGQVVAETTSLLRASGRRQVVLAPAFPAQGRTVKDGTVQVNGVPLALTGFAKDALAPPPLSPMQTLFSQHDLPVQTTSARGPFELDGIFIPDTASEVDMTATVEVIQGRLDKILLVGSAGLTRALAGVMVSAVAIARRIAVAGNILFVVGSRAAQTAAQVDALCALPRSVVTDSPCAATTWPKDALQVILRAPQNAGDAEQVARELAHCALALRRAGDARAMIATGGDTAVAILTAAGCNALQVMGELMPGVPFSQLELDGQACWIVTKAGGFGTDKTLLDVANCLRSGHEDE